MATWDWLQKWVKAIERNILLMWSILNVPNNFEQSWQNDFQEYCIVGKTCIQWQTLLFPNTCHEAQQQTKISWKYLSQCISPHYRLSFTTISQSNTDIITGHVTSSESTWETLICQAMSTAGAVMSSCWNRNVVRYSPSSGSLMWWQSILPSTLSWGKLKWSYHTALPICVKVTSPLQSSSSQSRGTGWTQSYCHSRYWNSLSGINHICNFHISLSYGKPPCACWWKRISSGAPRRESHRHTPGLKTQRDLSGDDRLNWLYLFGKGLNVMDINLYVKVPHCSISPGLMLLETCFQV